jgi:hypothetical protein
MRSLRRQLPALLIIVPLAAPGYYIMSAYGRHAPWSSLPHWAQLYLTAILGIIAIGMGVGLVLGAINTVRDRRKSKVFAQDEALRRLRPADREQS